MSRPNVEWDLTKAEANLRKHGVDFDEAASVFADRLAIVSPDPLHSDDEDRFCILGYSQYERILVVAYTHRIANTLRLISARRATRAERRTYEEPRR